MRLRSITLSISAKSVLLASALALSLPAQAQLAQEEPDVEDVARTPLDDLNIDSDDIPEALKEAVRDPYSSEGLTTCNDIVGEVARIEQALGPDFDRAVAEDDGGRINEGRVAQSVVGSLIPFRGIVREVSGANKRQRRISLAVTASMVRRGFLKGIGQQRGCSYPARPREDRAIRTFED